jgi:hypothetical protein
MQFDEFLNDVASRDLKKVFHHDYVFPKHDVADRLKEEIVAKTGCRVGSQSYDSPELLLSSRFLSASPKAFVSETFQRIREVVDGLKNQNAETFDLIFSNSAEHLDPTFPHCWGDEVQLRVRFSA